MRAATALGLLLAISMPATAQQNDYGGYDIVGSDAKAEQPYGETRGWQVLSAHFDGKFAYCVAVSGGGSPVRLGWDSQQWQLAVPITSKPDWQGTLQIDGTGSGRGYKSGGDSISGTAKADWTIAWLGMAELDGVRKGASAILGIDTLDYDFSLSGATAAILKVQECVEKSGKA